MAEWIPIIAPIAGIIISALLAWRLGKRKNSAESSEFENKAAKTVTEAVLLLQEPLNERIKAQEERISSLEEELVFLRPLPDRVSRLLLGIDKLIVQMRRLDIIPVWKPEKNDTIPVRVNV